MTKKMMSMILALVLILVTLPALATTTPSITTADLYTIDDYDVPLAGLFTIFDTLTMDAQAELDAITEYVNGGNTVADYFGMDIAALVESGDLSEDYLDVDLSQLVLSEYVSLGINNYQESMGDVSALFGFATEYQEGQTVLVMFGYMDDNGDIVWNALNAEVIDGQVKIDFPSDVLLPAGSEAILAILS